MGDLDCGTVWRTPDGEHLTVIGRHYLSPPETVRVAAARVDEDGVWVGVGEQREVDPGWLLDCCELVHHPADGPHVIRVGGLLGTVTVVAGPDTVVISAADGTGARVLWCGNAGHVDALVVALDEAVRVARRQPSSPGVVGDA